MVGRQLNYGHIRTSKTASLERQPDCFSTHIQDPITNSLCKFPRWQPAPNRLMAPLLLYVGQGNETREHSICATAASSGHGPLTVYLVPTYPTILRGTVIWIWQNVEESYQTTIQCCVSDVQHHTEYCKSFCPLKGKLFIFLLLESHVTYTAHDISIS